MTHTVSIIICTRNRAEDLRQTLTSLAQVRVPEYLYIELIVVDNGSNDHTLEVIRACAPSGMSLRPVIVPEPGLSRARNAGIEVATGEVILFTDDDVRLPPDWIERVCKPIISEEADAVAGGVVLAPHLRRPWMSPLNTAVLALTERLDPKRPDRMVGANMAFSRSVLERVPRFDTELGAGALGFAEETLFSWQLREAGFKIIAAFDVQVEHHCDPPRLTRSAYLTAMKKQGRAKAYIDHHWNHKESPEGRLRMYLQFARLYLKLTYRRLRYWREYRSPEGMAGWEMSLLRQLYRLWYSLEERKRPRNYDRHGLVKKGVPCSKLYAVQYNGRASAGCHLT